MERRESARDALGRPGGRLTDARRAPRQVPRYRGLPLWWGARVHWRGTRAPSRRSTLPATAAPV